MTRTLRIAVALVLIACGAAAYADPPARVARLNQISGPVSFAPADAPDDWTQAVLNRPLTAGDRLWADNTGRAELHMGSTALRLAALTSVDILNLDDDTLQLRLAQGTINLRVRELDQDDRIEIATPAGAVVIRQPGSYRISTDPQSDVSRVLVNYGQADLVTPTQTLTVPSSQSAVISAQAGISFEVAAYATGDEFDRWSADRDRREDSVASTRYVSRDMTGYEDLDQYGAWRTLPEYGAVWVPARVAPDWAPYRYGHWAWVSPWGWTWVDDAPWGFAPFHYGRWVHAGNYWAWAPGPVVRRPVYAPALVAFVGGSGFSVSARSGPAVGWFPLGWREPYRPWYRASDTYVRNVNVTHVTNVTNVYNNANVTNVRYAYRNNPQAVTVVPQQAFVSARPVGRANIRVAPAELARAEVAQARLPAEPVRASLTGDRSGHRPPPQANTREVVAVTAPARAAAQDTAAPPARRAEFEQRVRVIGRDRAEGRGPERPQAQTSPRTAPVQSPVPAVQAAPAPIQGQPAARGGIEERRSVVRDTPPGAAPPGRPPRDERRGAPRETPPPGAPVATAAPRADITPAAPQPERPPATAEQRSAPRPERRAAPERDRPIPQTPARSAPGTPQASAPQAEVRGRPPEHRAAPQAEARPAPRPEERRPPRAAEPPRARPAPSQQGEGATHSPAPQREVRFSERASAPDAGHAPAAGHAEATRNAAPQPQAPHERRPHPGQP
jgi:hypothetical protein